MFEQTSRLAQKLATSVSRRGFLGSLGGWAAAAAAMGMGVMLASGRNGLATRLADCADKCCCYSDNQACPGTCVRVKQCNDCLPSLNGCPLVGCFKNVLSGTPPTCTC